MRDGIERPADDQDAWAESFFDGWKIMQTNGYDNLQDGPQESWLGYQLLAGIYLHTIANMKIKFSEYEYLNPFVFNLISKLFSTIRT